MSQHAFKGTIGTLEPVEDPIEHARRCDGDQCDCQTPYPIPEDPSTEEKFLPEFPTEEEAKSNGGTEVAPGCTYCRMHLETIENLIQKNRDRRRQVKEMMTQHALAELKAKFNLQAFSKGIRRLYASNQRYKDRVAKLETALEVARHQNDRLETRERLTRVALKFERDERRRQGVSGQSD